ncbi:GNAT family N-acetyltransferase [Ferrimonas lipolytica]|uniref:GNAT family N-acetyltransferase n=1 Tax=Ferrimonas lipolytica TaxID=2724191 RepID=A0A6H1UCD5_9GAMM|nr:GNAT family N-acetyltransferase [Ferrimonas lipolytica]QIZ76704.1 GNAT family N-acetyltransferase [Ferrimonas lipolytica]
MRQPLISAERFTLRLLQPTEADIALNYYLSNSVHLNPWEPSRPHGFFSGSYWQNLLQMRLQQFNLGEAVHLGAIDNHSQMMIASCNFTQIDSTLPHGCFLGYSIDQYYQGSGLMTQIVTSALDYIYSERHIHTVTAAYMPSNLRSGQLLARLGFQSLGLERDYLEINGKLEDHQITTKSNPNQFQLR